MSTPLRLEDGRALEVSRLGRDDAEALQRFVRRLSPRSRLQRYFAPVAELSPAQLELAFAAAGLHLAARDAGGSIVALAQYALNAEGEAEVAVAVADAWQGLGLGRSLLALVLRHAEQAGVRRLSGLTQADNGPMQRLARACGFTLRHDADPALVRMERVAAA